jgi:peroxiredoxin
VVSPVTNITQIKVDRIVCNGVKKLSLAILLLLSSETFLLAAQPLKLKTDESAVNFTVPDLENKQVSLSDFKERPVILFFWTTWCPFCQRELKMLSNIYGRLQKDGLELLAINIGESSSRIDNFTKNYHLNFRVFLDKDAEVADAYDILGVPTYVFINKKGQIMSRDNYFDPEKYKELTSE